LVPPVPLVPPVLLVSSSSSPPHATTLNAAAVTKAKADMIRFMECSSTMLRHDPLAAPR
jgi:hypothetical protein